MNKKNVIGVAVALAVVAVFFLVGSSLYPFGGSNKNNEAVAALPGETTVTESAISRFTDIAVGDGAEVKADSVVAFNYIGRLSDARGKIFDSSESHGGPITVDLAAGGIIRGFVEGIVGMKVGGARQIVIPPELGYGSEDVRDQNGAIVIPGNSTLVFEVEIVGVSSK